MEREEDVQVDDLEQADLAMARLSTESFNS
jgi:hypothetical protein